MQLIVILSVVTIIQAKVTLNGILVNGIRHHREILREDIGPHYSLAINNNTNDLYSIATDEDNNRRLSIFNIDTRENQYITGLKNAESIAVDQVNDDVYVGNLSGIYKYHHGTDKVEIVAQGPKVWNLYFKNVLYYVTLFSGKIYTLINGESALYQNLDFHVDVMVIDDDENIVYVNNGKLYYHKRGANHDVFYERFTQVRSLTTDRNGKVYFSFTDGIYEFKNETTERVVSIDHPRDIVFDNENNIIYSYIRYSYIDSKLYRLKPMNL